MVVLVAQFAAAESANGDLEFWFQTNKAEYSIGEPVVITFSWKNNAKTPVKAERWRGPTAGVTRLGSDDKLRDFEVIGPDGKRLAYQGMFSCGGPRVFDVLQPGEERTSSNTLNGIHYGSYDFSAPGTYVLKSAFASYTYKDNADLEKDGPHWDGLIQAPDISVTVRPPKQLEFQQYRDRARTGDSGAILFLGINRDKGGVEALEAAFPGGDWNRRYAISAALAKIGTDEAVAILARLAKTVTKNDKTVLLNALGDSKNRTAIPILREYLNFDDDLFAWSTEETGARHKILVTRKVAASALRQFSIKTSDSVWRIPMAPGDKGP